MKNLIKSLIIVFLLAPTFVVAQTETQECEEGMICDTSTKQNDIEIIETEECLDGENCDTDSINIFDNPKDYEIDNTKKPQIIKDLEKEIEENPNNFILRAEYRMMNKKLQTEEYLKNSVRDIGDIYSISTITPLDKVINNSFNTSSFRLINDLEALTGQRAIDETLQLGSTISDYSLLSDTKYSLLELIYEYEYQKGYLPKDLIALKDIDIENIKWAEYALKELDILQNAFIYKVDPNLELDEENDIYSGFKLSVNKNNNIKFNVSEIDKVDIKSFDWENLIDKKEIEIPEISKIIPNDVLFVHITDLSKYLELEKLGIEIINSLKTDIYSFKEFNSIKPILLKKLGIKEEEFLTETISELAFISEDLNFMTNTDFALILNFKNDSLEKGFNLIKDKEGVSKKIGKYFVVSTNKELIERIEKCFNNKLPSISKEKDYHYMLSKIEDRRNGLFYLSEKFIRKLTGPKYKLNAERRGKTINTLKALQYTIFAYKKITGRFPSDLKEMVKAKYINKIPDEEEYKIDNNGIISHIDWGNLWEIKPVNQVNIDTINIEEYLIYKKFCDDYQSYFRNYFDPIGISFTVSDQIMINTIILPLIEKSDYSFFQSIFNNNNTNLEKLLLDKRIGAIQGSMTFSLDNMIVEISKEEFRYENEDILNLPEEERDLAYINKFEEKIAKELNIDKEENERLFDFIGNNVTFGVGKENNFSFNNIANIDMWLSIELKNEEKAKKFINAVYEKISNEITKEMGNMFVLSSTEPIKNEYNGKEYYMIPSGFMNIYYMFLNDNLYITISQLSINKIIDEEKDITSQEDFVSLKRNYDYIGLDHNIGGHINFVQLNEWLSTDVNSYLKKNLERMITIFYKQHIEYIDEAMTLSKILPEYDGTLSNVEKYYTNIPNEFYNLNYEIKDGEIYIKTDDKEYNIKDISTSNYKKDDGKILLRSILDTNEIIENMKETFKKIKIGALGFKFTETGLNIKMTVNNPYRNEVDNRFLTDLTSSILSNNKSIYLVIGIGSMVIIIGFVIYLSIKNKKK